MLPRASPIINFMSSLQDLKETIARLRGPGGCPWDQKQTHASLRRFLIEECVELLEAIDHEDMEHMCEELGDVLLQVYLHAQIAQEGGHFDIEAIAKTLNDKLIYRHPHVFGDGYAKDEEEVKKLWEELKSKEPDRPKKQGLGALLGLPAGLPGLLLAFKFCKKVARQTPKIPLPEALNLPDAHAVGEALFNITSLCAQLDIDPEAALRDYLYNNKDKYL